MTDERGPDEPRWFACDGTIGGARCNAPLPFSRAGAFFFRWGSLLLDDGAELEVQAHAGVTVLVASTAHGKRVRLALSDAEVSQLRELLTDAETERASMLRREHLDDTPRTEHAAHG